MREDQKKKEVKNRNPNNRILGVIVRVIRILKGSRLMVIMWLLRLGRSRRKLSGFERMRNVREWALCLMDCQRRRCIIEENLI